MFYPITNLIPYLCVAPLYFLWYSYSFITKHSFNTFLAFLYQLCFFLCVYYMFYYNQNSGKYPAKDDLGYIPLILESLGGLGVIYKLIMSDHEEFDIVKVKSVLIDKVYSNRNFEVDEDDYLSQSEKTTIDDYFEEVLGESSAPELGIQSNHKDSEMR